MPRRLIFPSLVMAVVMVVPIWSIAQGDAPPALREVLSLIAGAFVITMSSMVVNLRITGNYFGTIDREGFETPAHSALDRRHVILSANLAVALYAGLQIVVLLSVIAALSGSWAVFPLGLYLGLCLQVGGAPAYNLAAIVGPYRAQLKFSGGRQRGNLWGLLAWLVSAPPVLALIVLPYVFWKPGLALTLPLGADAQTAGAAAAAEGIHDLGSGHRRGMRPGQSRFRYCTYKAHLLKLVLLFVQVRPLGYNLNWVRMLHLVEPRGDPRCQRYTSAFDALHLACAESGRADVFLTTDDRLLRKSAGYAKQLYVRVENPLVWLREVS
jgi:hypothetical protein